MKSWIEISEERLAENYQRARTVLEHETRPDAALLAVVKANAYGHGAGVCAPVLARAGAKWLGVTDAAEGALVRRVLFDEGVAQPEILVMCGHLPEDAPLLVREKLTPAVWTVEQMRDLAAAAGTAPVPVHLEIDSGMSRQGVAIRDLPPVLEYLLRESSIRLDGVMTHFASAEIAGAAQTEAQREQFEAAMAMIATVGSRPRWVHAGNTSALDNGADGGTLHWLRGIADSVGARTMARAGLGLYGYALPLKGLVASDGEETVRLARIVSPVMTWKTRIVSITEVPGGTRIGYNGSFVAAHPMRLALLPVGYADGLRRELSSTNAKPGGWVMVQGRCAPIIGRISMNLTTIDVTGIEGADVGEDVILLGEGITAEDHAAIARTIPYEILCGLKATRTRPVSLASLV